MELRGNVRVWRRGIARVTLIAFCSGQLWLGCPEGQPQRAALAPTVDSTQCRCIDMAARRLSRQCERLSYGVICKRRIERVDVTTEWSLQNGRCSALSIGADSVYPHYSTTTVGDLDRAIGIEYREISSQCPSLPPIVRWRRE